VSVQARELYGALIGFGARVGEENVVHIRKRTQFVGERGLLWNINKIRGVNDSSGLLGNTLDQLWMGMAQA
jgi:hypothetical protein